MNAKDEWCTAVKSAFHFQDTTGMTMSSVKSVGEKKKIVFPYRESKPGRLGENQES